MRQPEVSVVMSCFNEEKHAAQSIQSILDQTFSNFEFIIINDGSSDKTEGILKEMAQNDSRILYVNNDKNLGLSASLNKGIELAQASLIARMDADDIADKERLQKQFTFMQSHPQVDVLGTAVIIRNRKGQDETRLCPEFHEDIITRIYKKPLVFHPTIMIKKKVYNQFGYYDETLKWAEDADLWYRIYDKVRFHNLQEALLTYRIKEKLSLRQLKTNISVKVRNLRKQKKLIQYLPQLTYDGANLFLKLFRYRF